MPYVNLSPERQTLDRQRQMAQALQQQAFSPIQMPNYPGANVSAAAPVSKLVEALIGALANKRLDKKEKNLQTSEDFQRLTQAGGLLNSLINPTPGSSYSVPMAPTQQAGIPDTLGGESGAAPPPQQPEGARSLALPPNPDEQSARGQTIQKLAQALTSRDPMISQFGNLQLQQALAGQNRSADQQFDIQKLLQQQAGQQGLQQASQQFQTGERKAGETFTEIQNRLNREATAANRPPPDVSNGSWVFQNGEWKQIGTPTKAASSDPYGEREVEHDGKVWIQTFAKDDSQARTLSERVKAPVKPPASANSADSTDYKFHVTEIDKRAKPIDDAALRLNRLTDSIGQGTAQADALLAPELLTVMAGGSGSGLRINEAEINRVQGGRPKIAQLEAKLRQWLGTDQKTAINFGPDERKAINDLVSIVNEKVKKKQSALTEASRIVSSEGATTQQRRSALADLDKQLRDIDSGGSASNKKPSEMSVDEILKALNQ